MILWYISNTTKRPHQAFLQEWLPRYTERFGHRPTVVYCHPEDAGLLDPKALGIEVVAAQRVQRGCFQVGHENTKEKEHGHHAHTSQRAFD